MAGTSYSALDPLAATRTTATQTPAHFERGHPDSGKSKRQIKTEKRIGSVLTAARNEEKRVGNDLMAALDESSPFFEGACPQKREEGFSSGGVCLPGHLLVGLCTFRYSYGLAT